MKVNLYKLSKIASFLLCFVLSTVFSKAQTVTNVAAGGFHSLFVQNDGSLWGMGANDHGQLGDGTTNNSDWPKQILTGHVTAISGGSRNTLFLKDDGSLWAMGDNSYGELGDGTYTDRKQPVQILTSGVATIASGTVHSLFIKSDSSLWGVGNDWDGELGDGLTLNTVSSPKLILASGVKSIAAGNGHSLFLKTDGSLWAMGNNQFGQLGDGTYNNTSRPKLIVSSGVSAIAAGFGHSLFLKTDGSLWAMGYNGFGQLGDGTYNNANYPIQIEASGVKAIAAGCYHSLFLKTGGSLWAMGDNDYGQLGVSDYSTSRRLIISSNVTAIAAGLYHSLYVKTDASLWAMGRNLDGELGNGTNDITSNINTFQMIVPTPVITTQPNSQTNTFGTQAVFAVNARSQLPMIYQWQKNGTNLTDVRNISGSNTKQLTITSISGSDAATYSVIVSNANFGVTSSIVTLTVFAPPSITSQPQPLSIVYGHVLSFLVTADGWPSLAYQWQFNGTNLNGATNAMLSMPNAFPAKAGYYAVVITNAYGSITSNPALFTVLPLGITSPTILPNGQFQFSFDTATGVNYAVQYSTNLIQWFSFVTLGGVGMPLTLIDPNTGSCPQRFYRIALLPQ